MRQSKHDVTVGIDLRIHVELDEDGFHAYCPKLRGLHSPGQTEEEALSNAKIAARAYIHSLIKQNKDPHMVVLSLSDLDRRFGNAKFEKIVTGAVKDVIKTHGPITDKYAYSAAKRVAGNTWNILRSIIHDVYVQK